MTNESEEPGAAGSSYWRRGFATLQDREHFVVEQYYLVGHTFGEIAEMLNLPEPDISRIHAAAVANLRRAGSQGDGPP